MKLHLPKALLTAVLAVCVAQTVQATITTVEPTETQNGTYTVTGGNSSDGDNGIVLPEASNYTLIFQIDGVNPDNRNYFNSSKTATGNVIIGSATGTTADDTQGLVITNGNSGDGNTVEFTGKVTGNGIIKRVGNPPSNNSNSVENRITFSGDMTDYIGNIYIGADNTFTLTLGGKDEAVKAASTSSTKGIAGTGNIQIATANSKLVFNYLKGKDSAPVYITNTISETGSVTGSTVTLKGGADYIFSKNVTVDNVNLEAGSLSLKDCNKGTANVQSAIKVSGGAKLIADGNDKLGWGTGATKSITLVGESADKKAILELGGRQTMATELHMDGNAAVTAIKNETSASGNDQAGLNAYKKNGAIIDVTGTNNEIAAALHTRGSFHITVAEAGELLVSGQVRAVEDVVLADCGYDSDKNPNGYEVGSIVKLGEGKITFSHDSSTFSKKYFNEVGTTIFEKTATFSNGMKITGGEVDLKASMTLSGDSYIDVTGGTLKASAGVTLTKIKQTGGVLKFTKGDNYITKGLDATNIDVTGSDKFALGVAAGTDKTKVFNIGTVTGSTKWELNEGQVSLTGESYTVKSLDVSNGEKSVADLSIGEGSTVTVQGNTWLNRSASISLDKDATINLGSTVSVKGVSSEEGAKGQIVRRVDGDKNSVKGDMYLTNNVEYSIKNAHVTITSDSDVNLSNQLDNSAITNNGTGTVSLGFGASDRTEVNALKGNINIMWMNGDNGRTDSLTKLEIGDNLIVAAQAEGKAIASITNLSTLEVTKTAIIGSNATVKANLTLTDGTTLTLSGFGDNAATINGNLTLGAKLKLAGEEFLEALGNLESGEMLKILNVEGAFSGLEADLSIAADAIIEEQPLIVGYTTSNYYSSLNVSDYALIFQGTELFIKNTAPIPEPTTATLSLLALDALAARRRRK